MAPPVRFERTATELTAPRSTTELQGNETGPPYAHRYPADIYLALADGQLESYPFVTPLYHQTAIDIVIPGSAVRVIVGPHSVPCLCVSNHIDFQKMVPGDGIEPPTHAV